ncbi:potassium transporter Trk [Salinibacterium hongtaonis]|uniref:Potassium transporter Trk n=1 Tax=Homoserinimonas hongtaonis TaxID=2079791 RepID=A0A2U1T3S3_9MICO|nr:potassium transporter Trk [Salinibacterium hongtaonis]PWB98490.1 potassium transporter Trk [Salinibacterium hongtaonis]
MEPVVEVQQLSIRRAPRIPVFLVLGGLVGFIVALILTTAFEIDPLVGFPAMLGYLSIFCIPAGIALGALVGLLLDRRSSKRARQLTVEHESVREPEHGTDQP